MNGIQEAIGRGALRSAIKNLTFSSNATPTIRVNDPFGPTPPSLLGSIVRPRIELDTAAGRQVVAPWGEPVPYLWAAVLIGLPLALVGIGYWWGRR